MTTDETAPEPLNLGDLRGDIAAWQQPVIESPQRLNVVRARLLASAAGRLAPQRSERSGSDRWNRYRLLWAAGGGAVLAAAAVLMVVMTRGRLETASHLVEAPLSFEFGAGHMAGHLDALMVGGDTEPVPVRFSDGTTLSLAPLARMRVNHVGSEGARLVLEDGMLVATVRHRARSRWQIQAGPYAVLVTGTRFDVRWDAHRRRFALDLHEGSVTVFGPGLGEAGRRVRPQESVRLSDAGEGWEEAAAPPPAATLGSSAVTPGPLAIDPPRPARRAAGARSSLLPFSPQSSLPSSPQSWRALALAGDYREAFAVAEAAGFSALCQRAPAADLLLLGNSARFAQQPAAAAMAFQAARARPGPQHQRAVAAFELGRLAHDGRGAYREAAGWFDVYLESEPRGQLAREAAGRLVEALHKAGDVAGARAAATRYLALFPDGPYRALADKILAP